MLARPGARGSVIDQRFVSRRGARRLAAGAACLALCAGCGAREPDAALPDVVLIVLDTARADHFSYAGWSRPTTPAIDAFRRDAVDYRTARSVSPWTLPAHMSLFTGLPPGEHGATWEAIDHPAPRSLDPVRRMQAIMSHPFRFAEPGRLLPRRLKERGYATLGISNNPWVSARTGFDEGFDALHAAWRHKPRAAGSGDPVDRGKAGRTFLHFQEHLERRGLPRPFFLFLNFVDTHYPYLPPRELAFAFEGDPEIYERMADPRRRASQIAVIAGADELDVPALEPFYDAGLRYADLVVDRFLGWLRREGLYDGALVAVTSDHGEHLGERGLFSHQLSVEEELLRIPLLVKYPGNRGAGTVVDGPLVSIADLYQTILAAAGDAPAPQPNATSQDLSDMARFDRSRLLAESYFSEVFLSLFESANADFDLGPHRVVRRAVYADGHKLVFRGLELERTEALAPGTAAPEAGRIADLGRWLRDYAAGIARRRGLEPAAPDPDPEMIEALEELGYLEPAR